MSDRYHASWYYKRTDGRRRPHTVQWYEPGTVKRHVRAFPTRDLALRFKERIDAQLNRTLLPVARIAWADACKQYIEALELTAKPRHVALVSATLKSFRDLLARPHATPNVAALPALPLRLDLITPATVREYFRRRQLAGRQRGKAGGAAIAPRTLARDHEILAACFAWLVREQLLAESPMRNVQKTAVPKANIAAPTTDDWLALLRVIGTQSAELRLVDAQAWHLLVLLGVLTGLDGETVLLQMRFAPSLEQALRRGVRNVIILGGQEDRHVGMVYAQRAKTSKPYVLALPPTINDRFAQRSLDLPEANGGWVFHWQAWPRNQWGRIKRAAGYQAHFRHLRRTSALLSGIHAAEHAAQKHLGHHSAQTTRAHYLDAPALAAELAATLALPELPPLPAYQAIAPGPRDTTLYRGLGT